MKKTTTSDGGMSYIKSGFISLFQTVNQIAR